MLPTLILFFLVAIIPIGCIIAGVADTGEEE